jgi:hypothetical protein
MARTVAEELMDTLVQTTVLILVVPAAEEAHG